MPLRATIDGKEKISLDFTDMEWTELTAVNKLNAGRIELPCCKQPGFPRTSTKGLKHFVHVRKDNSCDWQPETPEHLAAKAEVIKACKESGWEPIPEFAENDWRADVLAVRDGKRLAFEIQWSTQTGETTEVRQKKYRESGVRACWFFRTIPKQFKLYKDHYQVYKDIPYFKLEKGGNGDLQIVFGDKRFAVKDFVNTLLNKKIKFCNFYKLAEQEVEISFYKTVCWKCGKPQDMYMLNRALKACCDADQYMPGSMWDDEGIDKDPEIIKAVKDIVLCETSEDYKIGNVKVRHSKTVEDDYLSFGCYYCDAISGDWFVAGERRELMFDDSLKKYREKLT